MYTDLTANVKSIVIGLPVAETSVTVQEARDEFVNFGVPVAVVPTAAPAPRGRRLPPVTIVTLDGTLASAALIENLTIEVGYWIFG